MDLFITFRDKDANGVLQYYILQREFPHYIGIISEKYEVGDWYGTMAGYRMYVKFGGTIRGMLIPSYPDVGEEIQSVLGTMADWFVVNRIMIDEKRYKKFKLNAASPLQ